MKSDRYIVVQIDMSKHPRTTQSEAHTGDGVLFPVSCDGYYFSAESAEEVAQYLREKSPHLRTHVAKIVDASK